MQNENGTILTDKELLREALDHMAEALCFLFETEDPLYHSLAFMCDSTIKLGTVILNDGDRILDAGANWEGYEAELYERFNKLRVIK